MGVPERVVDALKSRLGKRNEPARPRPWLSDSPPDLETAKDAFGVSELIDGLVDTLDAAMPPFTVSLSGSWGIGKSTVAEAVVARLRKRGRPAVLLDAWTEDIASLRRSLVIAVAAALHAPGDMKKEAAAREDIARKLDEETRQSKTKGLPPKAEFGLLRSLLAAIRNPVPLLGLIGLTLALVFVALVVDPNGPIGRTVPPILGVLVGFLLVNSGYFFVATPASVTTGPAERSVLEAAEFRKYVIGTEDSPERVIVVVDNLDRLPGEVAVKALSEIRALVEIKNSRCIFLIPVDRGALVGHISGTLDRGAEDSQEAVRAARDYLDKFFNLDLLLTRPEPVDIRDWALEQAKEILPGYDDEDLRSAVQIVAYAAGSSPRAVKRILNGVSSRLRLLGTSETMSLTKLALVESLLAQFPDLLGRISEDPRGFVEARDELARAEAAEAQSSAVAKLASGGEVVPLASFLIAYRDIELSAPDVRLILSLRRDREWSGISNPDDLRAAVREGNIEGFATALKATPEEEQEHAVERAIYQVERSRAYPRDALNAILVAVPAVATYPRLQARLHRATVEILLANELPRRLITIEVATFVFGRTHWRLADLAKLLVATLASQKDKAETGLIQAVQLAKPQLDPQTTEAARKGLADLPPESLTTLFEPTVDLDLVEGPVAAAFAGRAAQLDMAVPDQEATLRDLRRLGDFRRGGGEVDPSFAPIAARLTSQLTAVSGDLSGPALEVLAASVPVLRGLEPTELDPLAAALEGRAGTNRAPYFDAILGLDVGESREKSTSAQVDAWLGTSGLEPEPARSLLESHLTALDRAGSTWRDLLCKQWLGQKKAAFAATVAELGGPDGRTQVVAAITQAAVPEVPARATEAIAILGDDEDSLRALAAGLGTWVKSVTPITAMATVATAFAELEKRHIELNALTAAITERADLLSSGTDIAALVRSVEAIEAAGCSAVVASADALARRTLAVGVTDGPAATWVALKSSDTALGTKVVADAVRSPNVPVPAAVTAADATRNRLGRTAEIALALAERAAAPATTEPEAESLLRQAKPWRPQPSQTRREYEDRLSEIAGRWSDLDKLINDLKLVGKRRR